ncbi:exodeoxyribonuclease V, gamma subunit [Mycobacterium avium subsp. avium 2285 (R)]|nr:exodeoxyribonuclease V, gamma subunit [Mycobacterium avium subsp. avium 2285 (R)]
MPLHLHRAERTDLLADGLGALLANPPADPFALELVVVPARGVERWLSQRLSHVLGRARDGDGVCAGVQFRSPGSLIAEITGTAEDDPWSPDALAWPLLEAIDCSLDEPWCRTLATHLGHFHSGAEAELRRTRRYEAARRLAGLFAGYARQRPRLLVDWLDGDPGDLDEDLRWQPPLWRALVARWPPIHRTFGTPKPSPGCGGRPATCRSGCRCSGTPGWRAPTWSSWTRWPPTTTCTCGCRTRATGCGARWPARTA